MRHIFLPLLAVSLVTTGCYHNYYDEAQREVNAEFEYDELAARSQIPFKPLSLDDIIEIALRQNLDSLVKVYEYEVQREVVTGERLKMLPSLIATIDTSMRSENTGSSSQSLIPTIPPAPPSISVNQGRTLYNFYLLWNLLDFGLAYFRSAQEFDKALILRMEYERLQQNVVLDVTKQYWKAIAAKKALEKGKVLIGSSKSKAAIFVRQVEAQLVPTQRGLVAKTLLLNIERDIQRYERDYHEAIMALAQLMAMPPCFGFELEDPCLPPLPCLRRMDICELELCALKSRPELFIGDLQEEVMVEEARMAILQMFPSPEIYGGYYNDTNTFLIYNHWWQMGFRATWNLLNIPRQMSALRGAKWRQSLARQNRLAVSIGIITQVHLSFLTYLDAYRSYSIATDLNDTYEQISAAAQKEEKVGRMNSADVIKIQADALFSEIDAIKAYGLAQIAIEQLNNALGTPRYFGYDDGCNCGDNCGCNDNLDDVGSPFDFNRADQESAASEGYTEVNDGDHFPMGNDPFNQGNIHSTSNGNKQPQAGLSTFPYMDQILKYRPSASTGASPLDALYQRQNGDGQQNRPAPNPNVINYQPSTPNFSSSNPNYNESWMANPTGEGSGQQYGGSVPLPSSYTWDTDSTQRQMMQPDYTLQQRFDTSMPIRTPSGTGLDYDPDFDQYMNPNRF